MQQRIPQMVAAPKQSDHHHRNNGERDD